MLTLSPTQPPEAPGEQQITQEAARQMLAALRNTTTRLDELVRRLRAPNQGDVYAALAGYSAIHAAEGRASCPSVEPDGEDREAYNLRVYGLREEDIP